MSDIHLKTHDLETQAYHEWPSRALADPRNATVAQFHDGLGDIISAEGPMLVHRAYLMYAKAGGVSRVTSQIQVRFDMAFKNALDKGLFVIEDEHDSDDILKKIVRLPNTPYVTIRTLGSRSFHEVPPSEVAEIILHLRSKDELMGREELIRETLAHYGLIRVTQAVKNAFDHILEKYF